MNGHNRSAAAFLLIAIALAARSALAADSVSSQAGCTLVPLGAWPAHPGEVRWSEDLSHTAFIDIGEGKKTVFFDGKPQPSCTAIQSLQVVGGHVLYAAQNGDHWTAVVDGKPGPQRDQISHLSFLGPSGERFVYAAATGRTWSVVVDGKPVGSYQQVWDESGPILAISFDLAGTRLAYSIGSFLCPHCFPGMAACALAARQSFAI